jgi:hypothetical protein
VVRILFRIPGAVHSLLQQRVPAPPANECQIVSQRGGGKGGRSFVLEVSIALAEEYARVLFDIANDEAGVKSHRRSAYDVAELLTNLVANRREP